MNTDIRLQLSFRNHPKTKKLRFALGNDGVISFIWLLMFVAESKPDGLLDGMDETDIALAADYPGDPAEFVRILTGVHYLKQTKSGYKIHGWAEHNAYAAGAKDRSNHGKKAAAARWKKGKGHDYTKQTLSDKNNAPSTKVQCPSSITSTITNKTYVQNVRFAEWWNAYAKKVNRKGAERIWKRRKLDGMADKLIEDTKNRHAHCAKWSAGYQPNPTTYLNQDRWEDEIETKRPEKRVSGVPKSDEAAIQYGISHGIQAKPGESMWDYRQRLQATL